MDHSISDGQTMNVIMGEILYYYQKSQSDDFDIPKLIPFSHTLFDYISQSKVSFKKKENATVEFFNHNKDPNLDELEQIFLFEEIPNLEEIKKICKFNNVTINSFLTTCLFKSKIILIYSNI